ncbi:hypothetical protein AB6A40_011725 [Gnathostoma spinigerum]|uniref:Uncharacterized protein n=1 Tax=Gnathostoma spinigerum TaxID=75299 RepID=A0ABD6F3G5_9BILA
MRRKWISLRSKSKQFINATIMVDTTEVKNFPVPVQGELVWPRLLTSSVVNFPLTAVGNFTVSVQFATLTTSASTCTFRKSKQASRTL